jgi:hypothetical protein
MVIAVRQAEFRARWDEFHPCDPTGAVDLHGHGVAAWRVQPATVLHRDSQAIAVDNRKLGAPTTALAAQYEPFGGEEAGSRIVFR